MRYQLGGTVERKWGDSQSCRELQIWWNDECNEHLFSVLCAGIWTPSYAWTWELDHKKGWVLKSWCFQIVVLEKALESPLDCKEIKPVNPKGNQPRIFIGRTDAEVNAPILWPPDVKSQLVGKDPDAAKDWGQEGEGGERGCDGCMASPTQWMWIWANSRRQEDRGDWCVAVREIVKGRIQLRDWTSMTCLSNISLYVCITSSLFSPLLTDF